MSSNNAIPLNYIVFDDEIEEVVQNNLNVKVEGFICNLIFINPNDFYNASDDTFNIDEFKEKIAEDTKGLQINLVATDWNMQKQSANYGEINGLEIVEILLSINDKYKKCPFLIYSGKPKDASQVVVSKISRELSANPNEPIYSLELLSLLLELKVKFCARNSRFDEIKTLIKGEKSISLIVLNTLANAERNFVINTGNEYFDGKSIGDLVDLSSNNIDGGLKFIREFMELSIANYTELNAN